MLLAYPIGGRKEYFTKRNKWGTSAMANKRRRLLRHLIVWFKERDL